MSNWRPIETAPNMKAVLVYAAGCRVAHFNTTNQKWWTYTDGQGTAEEKALNTWNTPTHWMPLPAPPGEEEECDTTKIPHEGSVS